MHEGTPIKIETTGDLDLVIESAMDLYEVPRTGWLNHGVDHERVESVGEHTEAVDSLFEQLIEKIDPEHKLDRLKMKRLIQIHDWPESLAGDQVAYDSDPEKEKRLKKKKEEDELQSMQKICTRFGDKGKILMDLWLEYEKGETFEAQVIKQLDKLQFFYKAWEYEQSGEKINIEELIEQEKTRNRITNPVIRKLFLDLEEKCEKML